MIKKLLPIFLMIFAVGCAPAPQPVHAVKGRVVSCWEEQGKLTLFTTNNELKALEISSGMPSCIPFKDGGIWEIHYRFYNTYAYDNLIAIDWIQKQK
jgi:hypothetical protein